ERFDGGGSSIDDKNKLEFVEDWIEYKSKRN
ncbi:hypothetical protein CJI50_02805, partial [Bifidobacteriaceae bacterium NR021]